MHKSEPLLEGRSFGGAEEGADPLTPSCLFRLSGPGRTISAFSAASDESHTATGTAFLAPPTPNTARVYFLRGDLSLVRVG